MHKKKNRDARANNARTHGAFASISEIQAHQRAEFDDFVKDFIAEYRPSGPSEKAAVEEIAKCIWRKRRVAEFFLREELALTKQPLEDELRHIQLILVGMRVVPPTEAWELVKCLPESVRRDVRKEFHAPGPGADAAWTATLVQFVELQLELTNAANLVKSAEPEFHADQARRQFELTLKYAGLDEQLDRSLERKIKRLAMIKTYKEVMHVKATESKTEVVEEKNSLSGRKSGKQTLPTRVAHSAR